MNALRRSTRLRLVLSACVGLAAGFGVWMLGEVHLGVTIGITVAEVCFVAATWGLLWTLDERATAENARREDFNPVADELLVVASSLAIVSVIALQLVNGAEAGVLAAVFTLIGVFGAWACVQQTYSLHYASLYYREPVGGLDFNQSDPPRYSDFVYFSYAVGITYGTTDVAVGNREFRAIVLRHGLTAFIFGLVILGASVNLVAGVFGLGG